MYRPTEQVHVTRKLRVGTGGGGERMLLSNVIFNKGGTLNVPIPDKKKKLT